MFGRCGMTCKFKNALEWYARNVYTERGCVSQGSSCCRVLMALECAFHSS